MQIYPVIRRRTGKNPIEILRIALRFGQSLLTSGGTADKVSIFDRLSVACLGQHFSSHSHQMGRAITEVFPYRLIADATIRSGRGAHFGRYRSKSQTQWLYQHHGQDHASWTAIANTNKIAIPSCCRQPQFDPDIAIRFRFCCYTDPDMLRYILYRKAGNGWEIACRNEGDFCNLSILQICIFKLLGDFFHIKHVGYRPLLLSPSEHICHLSDLMKAWFL